MIDVEEWRKGLYRLGLTLIVVMSIAAVVGFIWGYFT